jgi:hypothetical protein
MLALRLVVGEGDFDLAAVDATAVELECGLEVMFVYGHKACELGFALVIYNMHQD